MTLSFTSRGPLGRAKVFTCPVPSSTYLSRSFISLLLSSLLSLSLGSDRRGRNQISSFSVFILPTWTIIIAPHVFALRFSNTNRYGRHDSLTNGYIFFRLFFFIEGKAAPKILSRQIQLTLSVPMSQERRSKELISFFFSYRSFSLFTRIKSESIQDRQLEMSSFSFNDRLISTRVRSDYSCVHTIILKLNIYT